MKIETTTQSPATCEADWLILLTVSDDTPGSTVTELDAAIGGRLATLRERSEFQAEKNETLGLYQVDGITAANLLLVGVGSSDQLNLRTIRQAVLCGLRTCCQRKEQSVAVAVDNAVADSLPAAVLAQMFAESATIAATDADIYRRKPARHELTAATLCVSSDTPMDTDDDRAHTHFSVMSFRDRKQLDHAYAYMLHRRATATDSHHDMYSRITNSVFLCWQDGE